MLLMRRWHGGHGGILVEQSLLRVSLHMNPVNYVTQLPHPDHTSQELGSCHYAQKAPKQLMPAQMHTNKSEKAPNNQPVQGVQHKRTYHLQLASLKEKKSFDSRHMYVRWPSQPTHTKASHATTKYQLSDRHKHWPCAYYFNQTNNPQYRTHTSTSWHQRKVDST